MRKLVMAAVLTFTVLLPGLSQAGWLLEASVGKGAEVSKPRGWEQVNVMLAPGYAVSILQLQLGIVGNFADKSHSATNLELRPMIAIVPPVLPIYGRVIFAVSNLTGRSKGRGREFAYGAAVGVRFGLGPIGVFGEVGVLPRNREESDPVTNQSDSSFVWILEARAGALIKF
jgi:hypothetical protein